MKRTPTIETTLPTTTDETRKPAREYIKSASTSPTDSQLDANRRGVRMSRKTMPPKREGNDANVVIIRMPTKEQTDDLFAWLIGHQSTALFSENKGATSTFSQNKLAPTTNHQPKLHAASFPYLDLLLERKMDNGASCTSIIQAYPRAPVSRGCVGEYGRSLLR
jgi:hypothetical protein